MDIIKSQYVTDSFADERHSRELKAGLHPLRVCPLFFASIDFQFDSDLSWSFDLLSLKIEKYIYDSLELG